MKVLILGGGYAGMACAIELRNRCPSAEIAVADPDETHLKLTLLHQTVTRPLSHIRVPFAELASRFEITHHRGFGGGDAGFDETHIERWARDRSLELVDREGRTQHLAFDYLVLATGARPVSLTKSADAFDQEYLRRHECRTLLEDRLGGRKSGRGAVSVVGGGASGLQFVFELAGLARRQGWQRPRLIDEGLRILPALPARAHDYAIRRMDETGIDYRPGRRFVAQRDNLVVHEGADGERLEEPSALSLLFPGVRPWPCALQADGKGQVKLAERRVPRVFAAGDCVHFASPGLNARTAQAAVRKGRHVAVNIARHHRRRPLLNYYYSELGYVVRLGELDAVGWMLARDNVLEGLAALAVHGAVEAQYELSLRRLFA